MIRFRFPNSRTATAVAACSALLLVAGGLRCQEQGPDPAARAPVTGPAAAIPLTKASLPCTLKIEEVQAGEGRTLGPVRVTEEQASLRAHEKRGTVLGPVQNGVYPLTLSQAVAGKDNVVTVQVPGAVHIKVTLTAQGQTATELGEGEIVKFFLRNRNDHPYLMAASALYHHYLAFAQAAAIPGAKRPQKFIVADFVNGPGPSESALEDTLATFEALGTNTLQISGFGRLSPQVAQRAAAHGINGFAYAGFAPPNFYDWANPPDAPAKWAQGKAKMLDGDGVPRSAVSLFKIAEEPTWYYPTVDWLIWRTPDALRQYREYLKAQGLSPADVGGATWDEVKPLPISQATSLPLRRRHYWTVRFCGEGAAKGFHNWAQALRTELGPNVLPTANCNPFGSRPYWSGNVPSNPETADLGTQWPFWMDIGRYAAPFGLWTEDWADDQLSEMWSYHADILRCAARQTPGNTFGGNLVGRRFGRLGTAGGKYRALALTGHGGKALLWYNYGPEPLFSEFSWSDNQIAYSAIAQANALLGSAEDVLYPGTRGNAQIALLLPRSAYYWGPKDYFPYYERDLKGYYYALTHAHYPVDFVDEEGIASGELAARGFKVLYVTSPNLSGGAVRGLQEWVKTGGTVVFSGSQAGGADEYNSKSTALNELRGVASKPRDDADGTGTGPALPPAMATTGNGAALVRFEADGLFPATKPVEVQYFEALKVTTGHPEALAGGGKAAIVSHRFGKGLALSYGFRPGSLYWNSVNHDARELPTTWSAEWRGAAAAPAALAGATQPVECDTPVVEVARLDSSAGVAVTLLNWTGKPVDQLTVKIHAAGPARRVFLASGAPVAIQRRGDTITATLALKDVDVLELTP